MKIGYPGSLHNHTDLDSNIRIKDSIITVKELLNYAVELNHEVVALTGHEALCSHMLALDEYKKIKEKNPNFKVILGNEIYLCRNGLNPENYIPKQDRFWHFILLAKDAIGHKQLRELSTCAWKRSYTFRGMRRVPTYYSDLIDIVGGNPGHLIASTACLGSVLDHQLLEYHQQPNQEKWDGIQKWCRQMEMLFGKNNFYLELQPPAKADNEQDIVNHYLLQLAEQLDIPYIITTDSHYAKSSDAPIHKAYLNSQDGEREVDSFYATTYMMGTEEIEKYFQHYSQDILQQAYKNILNIKNACEDYDLTRPLRIPELIWQPYDKLIPDFEVAAYYDKIPHFKTFMESEYHGDKVLVKGLVKAIKEKPDLNNDAAFAAIQDCLDKTWESSKVNKAHWSAYLLNLDNIVREIWKSGSLVGAGRGSGVGFILNYALGITQINPLLEKTKTFSWRFLNPSRVSVVDLDCDIESVRRQSVIQHLKKVYGEERVSGVITFGSEQAKIALVDAARGLGLPPEEGLYLSSLIPKDRGIVRTLEQCYYGDAEKGLKPVPLFVKAMDENPELWRTACKFSGLICRIGSHAGGIVFVDEPFTDTVSLMKTPDGNIVTAYDLHTIERMSLIKMDLLSVNALDRIHTCLDLLLKDGLIEKKSSLQETYEAAIGIYNLERNDLKMWEMVWNHKILSLFQLEKASGIKGVSVLKPTSVDDLSILNSAIRLMPQDGEEEMPVEKLARFKSNPAAWDEELRRWHLGEKEKKILEPVLRSSYGLCITQEQFMELVQLPDLGSFSLDWSDHLRKSIAKKSAAAFDALTEDFFKTTKEKGIDQNFARYVWYLISMSKGYGFDNIGPNTLNR